jgi:GNAT superfamily N-acetyltransferase
VSAAGPAGEGPAAAVVMVRPAAPDDVATILRLIVELAVYEREPDAVRTTEADLTAALFGPDPVAECVIAEVSPLGDQAGEVAGFALFYRTFSTWTGVPGLWLEDLFVSPAARRGGVGGALLRALAAICVQRGYSRLEWSALDWNTLALDFYAGVGAERKPEWQLHRVQGEALSAMADGSPPRGEQPARGRTRTFGGGQ